MARKGSETKGKASEALATTTADLEQLERGLLQECPMNTLFLLALLTVLFVTTGLYFPPSDFLMEFLEFFGLQLFHLSPNRVLYLFIFAHLCDVYLGQSSSFLALFPPEDSKTMHMVVVRSKIRRQCLLVAVRSKFARGWVLVSSPLISLRKKFGLTSGSMSSNLPLLSPLIFQKTLVFSPKSSMLSFWQSIIFLFVFAS